MFGDVDESVRCRGCRLDRMGRAIRGECSHAWSARATRGTAAAR
jgi:hypothetical protein